MTRLPLSVIILTNRIDERLTKALRSVQWADQILVIDTTGQLSFTKEQQSLMSDLLSQPTSTDSFDFSALRNNALSHARHEWVFFLDSDEWFVESGLAQLRHYLEESSCYALSLVRTDIFLGQEMKYGEAGQMKLIRLGKKKYLRFARSVHEIAFTDQFVCNSKLQLKHESHLSLADFMKKIMWYAQLDAKLKRDAGHRFSWFELLVYPKAKFWHNYFLKLGFLDGWRGLVYAFMMSLHSFLVRIYLYELEHTQ